MQLKSTIINFLQERSLICVVELDIIKTYVFYSKYFFKCLVLNAMDMQFLIRSVSGFYNRFVSLVHEH
jgi:hypothetical protein